MNSLNSLLRVPKYVLPNNHNEKYCINSIDKNKESDKENVGFLSLNDYQIIKKVQEIQKKSNIQIKNKKILKVQNTALLACNALSERIENLPTKNIQTHKTQAFKQIQHSYTEISNDIIQLQERLKQKLKNKNPFQRNTKNLEQTIDSKNIRILSIDKPLKINRTHSSKRRSHSRKSNSTRRMETIGYEEIDQHIKYLPMKDIFQYKGKNIENQKLIIRRLSKKLRHLLQQY